MKKLLTILLLVSATAASAGFFDDVKDAVETTFSGEGADAIGDAFDEAGDGIANCFSGSQTGEGLCDKIEDREH